MANLEYFGSSPKPHDIQPQTEVECAPKSADYIEGKIVEQPSPVEDYHGLLTSRVFVFSSLDRRIPGHMVTLLITENDPDVTTEEIPGGAQKIRANYESVQFDSREVQATKSAKKLIEEIDGVGHPVDEAGLDGPAPDQSAEGETVEESRNTEA